MIVKKIFLIKNRLSYRKIYIKKLWKKFYNCKTIKKQNYIDFNKNFLLKPWLIKKL
jgi:hypothetical protein